ncbi:MAG: DUF6090 family protein [Xanthomonadales bacterium]|nr:DUF6090 family protein [Xanthomonadales bacterium]
MGEVLLIVVGILIALGISDWYDRRIDRQIELALLGEIRSTLETDLAALETKLDEINGAVEQMKRLEELLVDPRPYEPEMDRLFGAAYGFRMANVSTASYETLKSEGLQSVTNRELRALIARVFDHHYLLIEEWRQLEKETTYDILRPYYLQYFKDLRFHKNATPLDYEFIVNDAYFRNMIHYRISSLEFNPMDSYPEAIRDMRTAIARIDEEIAR